MAMALTPAGPTVRKPWYRSSTLLILFAIVLSNDIHSLNNGGLNIR